MKNLIRLLAVSACMTAMGHGAIEARADMVAVDGEGGFACTQNIERETGKRIADAQLYVIYVIPNSEPGALSTHRCQIRLSGGRWGKSRVLGTSACNVNSSDPLTTVITTLDDELDLKVHLNRELPRFSEKDKAHYKSDAMIRWDDEDGSSKKKSHQFDCRRANFIDRSAGARSSEGVSVNEKAMKKVQTRSESVSPKESPASLRGK